MNYEELVKALRVRSRNLCPGDICDICEEIHFLCSDKVMHDAAAAIEELDAEETRLLLLTSDLQDKLMDLQAEVNRLELDNEDYEHKNRRLHGEIEALQAQLPKRGKWIIDGAFTYNLRELNGKAYEPVYRCSCCNRQMESYLRLDEPKMPEDADFPEYCPHCGAKMEVQE